MVYNKQSTGAAVPGQMFTGDTQDVVSGIFDTPNRELNSSQGRWLSPDPAHKGWNLYAYTTNPNNLIDPSGLVEGTPCLIASPRGPHANCEGGGNGGGGGDDDDDDDDDGGSAGNGNGSGSGLCLCPGDVSSGAASSPGDMLDAIDPPLNFDAPGQPEGEPCSGAGVPCGVVLVGSSGQIGNSTQIQGPNGFPLGLYGTFQSYDYLVVDSNGDPVMAGDIVITENLSNLYSINGDPPAEGPAWDTNPFTDDVGYGTTLANVTPLGPYVGATIQTFSVQAGGLNYQLGTQVLQTVTYVGGTVMGNADIISP